LAVANSLAGSTLFSPHVLSDDGGPVSCFADTRLTADGSLTALPPTAGKTPPRVAWDILYIPPGYGMLPHDSDHVAWITEQHEKGSIVCAACAGVFLLAETGLLKERSATTHWGLADRFARQYPDVRLHPERMLVDNGDVICAGGLTAYFDLALHLIARFVSPQLTAACARTLLLDPGRTEQTPYMHLTGPAGTDDDAVNRAMVWLEENHSRPIRVGELAARANLGERTFLRRFTKATGHTPAGYLKALRVEHAKRLLESGSMTMDAIVDAVGYRDTPSFFTLFKKMTGLTPGDYRNRFGLISRR
jgi:transcriptional regulator GlxA family with amidase domain